MEQRKILWIVVAVSIFLLIIFGTAVILYAPSRSTGPAIQQAAAYTPASGSLNTTPVAATTPIDPDLWAKDPSKAPGLDSQIPPAQSNINLTIVNGENAAANYTSLDVNGLSNKTPPPVPSGQTPMTAPQSMSVDPTAQTQSQLGSVPHDSGKPSSTTTATAPSAQSKSATPVKTASIAPAAKAAVPAAVSVTEYWIQTGSFSSKLNAEKARDTLKARYLKAEIFTKDISSATTYRVRIGPYKSKAEAEYWLGTVKEIPDFSVSSIWEVKTKK